MPTWAELQVSPEERFLKVFDEKLITRPEAQAIQSAWRGLQDFEPSQLGQAMAEQWLQQRVKEWIENVPEERLSSFVIEVTRFARNLSESYPARKPNIALPHLGDVLDGEALKAEERRIEELRQELSLTGNINSSSSVIPYENPTEPMQQNNIAQRITAARKSLGFTQEEAATKWEISLGSLRDWEQERSAPRGKRLKRIEAILAEIESKSGK